MSAPRYVCVSHVCWVMIMWLQLALAEAQGGRGTKDSAWHRLPAEHLVRWAHFSTVSGSGGGGVGCSHVSLSEARSTKIH